MLACHPGEQGCKHHGSQNYPSRVAPCVAGIEMPQAIAKFARFVGHAVDEAVDGFLVHGVPEEISRDPQERTHDCGGVEFVDEIFADKQTVERVEPFGEAPGRFRTA